MLHLDIQRICEAKGIENPLRYLHKNGFTYHIAHRLLNNANEGILFKHLEKLCLLLQCTPDDLLAWHPADASTLHAAQPLHKLNRGTRKGNIGDRLKKLPPHQLDQIRRYIDNIGTDAPNPAD